MKLEHYSVEKLKKEILDIVGKQINLDEYKVFFFGSRVCGDSDERSDIDVGIEGPGPIPSSKLLTITEEIENIHTLYKIELVDFSQAGEKFNQVASQKIERIN